MAAGRPWQVFLSQTVFSQLRAPKLAETVGLQHRLLAWICRCVAAAPFHVLCSTAHEDCGLLLAPGWAMMRQSLVLQETLLTLSHSKLLLACSKALKTAVNEKRAGKEGAHMARMYLAFGVLPLPGPVPSSTRADTHLLLAGVDSHNAAGIYLCMSSYTC